MVKNVNNILLTEKIRFGRYTNETQPNNSIVINASNKELPPHENSGFYLSPIRYSPGSNIISYNSLTGEIVDSGSLSIETITQFGNVSNVHTKFKSLEVENLDVVHLNTIKITEIENPIFELGKNNTENPRDVLFTMRKGDDVMRFTYDGDLSVSGYNNFKLESNLSVGKYIYTHCIVSEKVKATDLEVSGKLIADGSFIKNITHEQLGDTFENRVHFKQGFETPWLSGDGSRITNLSLDQLPLTTKKMLQVGSLNVDGTTNIFGKVKIYSSLKITDTLVVNNEVKAQVYYGDGTKLTGVAHKDDVIKINAIEKCVNEHTEKINTLETDTREYKEKTLTLETCINSHSDKLDILGTGIEKHDKKLNNLEFNITKIDCLEDIKCKIKEIPDISPLIEENKLQNKKIKDIVTKLSNIKEIKEIVNSLINLPPKVKTLEGNVNTLNETNFKIFENEKEINDIFNKIEKIIIDQEKNKKNIKILENELSRITQLETEITRVDTLETYIPTINDTQSNVYSIQKSLPIFNDRIQDLETRPLRGDGALISNISLEHVISCGNITKKVIHADGGIKLPSLYFDSKPKLTSRIGQIKCININNIAEINGYNKANDGTTAGRPGGIIFKTKRPGGDIDTSMLIDGNGKVSIGSHKTLPCAILSLESKTGGFMLPRMTWLEMKNIKNPEPGLLVYDIESDTIFVYKSSGWTPMC